MGATGGTVASIALDARNFAVPDDNEVSMQLGGYNNEVKANGNRTFRLLKKVVPGKVAGIQVECDNSKEDHEYLSGLQDSNLFFDFSIEYIDGTIYTSRMQISGELVYSNANALCTFDVEGAKLVRQS